MASIKNFLFNDERGLFLTTFIFVSFFYLWDLGNIDGIRQGTEGFYLQISREMFEKPSFITPLYFDAPHWSKPPFQFWLPIPLYFLGGSASLLLARLSIVLFSMASLAIVANWIKRHFNISSSYSFIFIASSIGFLKYSRIFMMEIPLTLLSMIACLYFYDYFYSSSKKYLIYASLSLGLAILVKGPVALVMCIGGTGIFLLIKMFQERKFILKKITIWASLALLFSSIWFIICYLQHGYEFIDYFFLRENLGKFSSKSYPIRVVFQGLLLYGLPWTLFSPFIYFFIKDNWKDFWSSEKLQVYLFLFSNFIFFFLLWLIPNQRSHHYAMPSLPFFLILTLVTAFSPNIQIKRLGLRRFINLALGVGGILLSVVILSTLSFDYTFNQFSILGRIIFSACAILITSFFLFRRSSSERLVFHLILFSLGSLWTLLIPAFYLPATPERIIQAAKGKKVAAIVRKPYFVEEAFQRKIDFLNYGQLKPHIQDNEHLYIMAESVYTHFNLHESTEIIESWPVWIRGRKLTDLVLAMKARDISVLQENMLLLRRRSLD